MVVSLHVNDPKNEKIEHVHRSFTKGPLGFRDLSHPGRLKSLEFDTSERRRLIYYLCRCFRIVHGCGDACVDIIENNCTGLSIRT